MARTEFGRTGLRVERNGFGALPIQRISQADAVRLLRRARDGGMDFFDTARSYTDSEEKLGAAFSGSWNGIVLATKTPAKTPDQFRADLDASLRALRTDHIDLYQFHNPPACPRPGDGSGLYEAMLEAKRQGKIRFIGITNHRLQVAREAVQSGLYDALQFPFSYLSTPEETRLAEDCLRAGMGFVAMKALSGGLITDSAAACAWIMEHKGIVPIWGVQRERELEEFLSYIAAPPRLTGEMREKIGDDRAALSGEFCRGCGYCMPCPQGIQINTCARASLLLRRAPGALLSSESGRAIMKKVESCTLCGACAAKCPYGLKPWELIRKNYREYLEATADS